VDVETGRHVLKGALEAFDVSVQLANMVLKPFDPSFLLGKALTTLLLAVTDELRNVVSQSFVFHVVDIGESGADGSDDGGGEGSRM